MAILRPVDDQVTLLRGVPLFADLEAAYKAGDVLMLEGEPGDTFFVIVDGTVRIERGGRSIRSLTAGGYLGEIALYERRPRTATATCVTDVRLLAIRAHEFERLMDTLPEVDRRVKAAVSRRSPKADG